MSVNPYYLRLTEVLYESIGCFQSSSALYHIHVSWLESSLENWNTLQWLGVTAHENVQGCIPSLWPRMDRDVALGKHQDSRDSSVGIEVVQVAMEDGGS